MERAELPKPVLVELFERIAAILDIDQGQTSLQLYFDHGRLRRWSALDTNNGHERLREFDDRARQVL
jgi:hypothetical protein